jgi:hypothetical protein
VEGKDDLLNMNPRMTQSLLKDNLLLFLKQSQAYNCDALMGCREMLGMLQQLMSLSWPSGIMIFFSTLDMEVVMRYGY